MLHVSLWKLKKEGYEKYIKRFILVHKLIIYKINNLRIFVDLLINVSSNLRSNKAYC